MTSWNLAKSILCVLLATMAVSACARPQTAAEPRKGAPSGGFYEGMITFYRDGLNHMEGVRRGSCPMHPSCSQYSREAVARNGFVKGWIMTMDRLMRCGRDERKTARKVFAQGGWRYHDPVPLNEWPAKETASSNTAPDPHP